MDVSDHIRTLANHLREKKDAQGIILLTNLVEALSLRTAAERANLQKANDIVSSVFEKEMDTQRKKF